MLLASDGQGLSSSELRPCLFLLLALVGGGILVRDTGVECYRLAFLERRGEGACRAGRDTYLGRY